MLEKELINLVEKIQQQKCESNIYEIKAASKGCPKIYDTLSSFSNQENGGIIVFGIDEKDNYRVCGVYDAADLQKKVMEQCLQMEPEVRAFCTTVSIDGKVVVSVEIQEIDTFQKPCFYKGAGRIRGSYIRVGDGDRKLTEYEVYSYEAFKKKIEDELRNDSRADISELDTNNFLEYKLKLGKVKPNLSGFDDTKIKSLQGFMIDNKPTITGLLLFSNYPQAFFPQLCITAIALPGTDMGTVGNVGERFLDNARIDGTIVQMLDQAMRFVRKNIKEKTIIDSNTGKRKDKTEYPIIAIRELILNALIHRDYSIHTDNTPITIRIFQDRMEIENPGGLYGRMTIDKLGKVSADTRNPYLANAMEVLGETENRYSGIPTVINAMQEANLPKPEFISENGIFKAILYNENSIHNDVFDEVEAEIIKFCQIPRDRKELEQHFEEKYTVAYIMKKYMQGLIEKGIILLTIPNKPRSKFQKYVVNKKIID